MKFIVELQALGECYHTYLNSNHENLTVTSLCPLLRRVNQLRKRLRLQKLTFVFGGVESHVVTTESYLVFQQENPDNSKLAEKAAELTIGALLDVPPIFNGQTFDAIT